MASSSNPTTASSVAKIKVAGAWSGVIEADLSAWTLPMLRADVARKVGSDCFNMICGGKILRERSGEEEAPSLAQMGLKNNSKVLVTRFSADDSKAVKAEAAAADKAEEHSKRLSRIWEAAKSLAQRHSDGSFPLENYNIELEDQNGQKVMFGSEKDQKAMMMGLMLHANAKNLINKKDYKDAVDVLAMAEEAFSLCDPKFIEMIDNVPILQLDTVWCYFMLRDISCLSSAKARLEKARKGFERSHGKDSTRFRVLQAGRVAELAIYVRLELLEGVVAYHNGKIEEARKYLGLAQAKFMQLQVPDEALSLLMSMGYKEKSAKRALRMTGLDIPLAVDFLVEDRAAKTRRREEDSQRRHEIMEQRHYGKTPKKKAVDMEMLKELSSIGFDKNLAAEALRVNENDMQKALDLLTDPDKNCALQNKIQLRRENLSASGFLEELMSMGFTESEVLETSRRAQSKDDLLSLLTGSDNRSEQRSNLLLANNPDGSANAALIETEEAGNPSDQRDAEMEEELALALDKDPLADYDVEVNHEGEAIAEYLTLVNSHHSYS